MSEQYAGRQIVGIDLHRRRSVLVRMTETGDRLETVRISNDPEYLREVMTRAGEAPEVVLEATYGWYWAADTLAELGATVHLAHPLGVKMFSYRRVKNDERDAVDLADLLRMGRLPEAAVLVGIPAAVASGSVSADAVAIEARKHTTTGTIDVMPAAPVVAPQRSRAAVVTIGARRQATSLAALPADRRPAPSVRDYDQLLTRRAGATGPGQGQGQELMTRPATRPATRDELTDAAIEQACRILRLPTIREQHARIAEAAARQKAGYKGFLVELLSMECDEREDRRKTRLIREAEFPRAKRLDDFDFTANPLVDPGLLHTLAKGAWIRAGQPLCLIGDSGTGKSHLLIGLGIAGAEAGYKVRYVTAAALVNELVEAADDKHLSRTIARYGRVDLLCLDELGYLELDRRGAELLFQVFTEREERASVAVASNSAFSEWARTFTDPRHCAAIVDRITFEAHIIETGTESYRLRATQRSRAKTRAVRDRDRSTP